MRMLICFLFCLFVQLIYNNVGATIQHNGNKDLVQSFGQISTKQLHKLRKKYEKMERAISNSNQKAIAYVRDQEIRIRKKTDKSMDSSFLLSYREFENGVNTTSIPPKKVDQINDYLAIEDSLLTGIQMLNKMNFSLPGFDAVKQKSILDLGQQLQAFQTEWQKHKSIKDFISNRRDVLKDKLTSAGGLKELDQINKQVYYYQKQIDAYRELLKSPDQMVKKFMGLLREQSSFRQFMANNSQLAQLFRLPGQANSTSYTALAGLQTRTATGQMLQQQFQGQGQINPSTYFQDQLNVANTEMDKWKKKINDLGGGEGGEMNMPDFRPNTQKTKSFLKRIEWGTSIQSQRPNGLFPVTSDIALTVGYKLNDKSVIGVGVAYKIGWGKNFSNISISHQGIGLRSFLDIQLKGSLWISGGYELNYQQEFNRIDQLKSLNAWQKSGLIGLSKKYMIGKKKGNLQVLWDVLSYSQLPRTQPIKFRIGYYL